MRIPIIVLLLALVLATVPAQARDLHECAGPPERGSFVCVQDEDTGTDPQCTAEPSSYAGSTSATALVEHRGLRAYAQADADRSCTHTDKQEHHERTLWAGGSVCHEDVDACTGGSIAWWSTHGYGSSRCGAAASVVMPDGGIVTVPVPSPTEGSCPGTRPPDPGWGDLLP